MKIHLQVRRNYKDNDYQLKWDYETNDATIYPDNECRIEYVTYYPDEIVIGLSQIPARIDLSENKYLWVHGFEFAKIHPEPYKSLPEWESHTIYKHPDLELVESVG